MSRSRKIFYLLVIFSCIVVHECKPHETKGYGGNAPQLQGKNIECPTFTVKNIGIVSLTL